MSALRAVFYFLLAEALVSALVSAFVENNVIKEEDEG